MELQESLSLEAKIRRLFGKRDERYSDSIRLHPCRALGRMMFELLYQDSHSFTPSEKAGLLFAGLACVNATIDKGINKKAESNAVHEVSVLLDELTDHE